MSHHDIPPAGIRLVRESRGEDRPTFADRLDVSPKTVGNWERGESPPNDENRETLLAAMPDHLSLEEVQNAEGRFDEGPAYGDEQRLFGSKWLQALHDEPRTADELGAGRGVNQLTPNKRMFVERLDLTGVEGAGQRDGERVRTVYYLEGDERRALRRFIEENEAVVREQLGQAPNRFSHEWDDWLYALLEEEWRFWIHG